jgi:hypothetical protein
MTEALTLASLVVISNSLNPTMATDAQSLLTQSKCFSCYGISLFQAMKLALLAQISVAHNPSNNTDPAFLITQANCFDCFSASDVGQLMELVLLQQIAS